jgi:hypothetical protein
LSRTRRREGNWWQIYLGLGDEIIDLRVTLRFIQTRRAVLEMWNNPLLPVVGSAAAIRAE